MFSRVQMMFASPPASTVLLLAAMLAVGPLTTSAVGQRQAIGTTIEPAATPERSAARRAGPVRLDGRAFADAAGRWNPLGASLFWALWGERHDPDRLERELTRLSGVDYVRILGMVGTESWQDRRIDPHATDYWKTVDHLFERLERHGLRAHVTVFADAQVMMPDHDERRAFADRWVTVANAHTAQMQLLEVANEGWQNGLEDARHLRELGRRMASQTSIPVALSSMPEGQWCTAYAGAAADGIDVVSIHYDRNVEGGEGGAWRPVWQPWRFPAAFDGSCRGRLPAAAVNSEPIGPGSSVAEEHDPWRLALSLATTFIAGNAAYVLHGAPGVRGGGAFDRAQGRAASWADVDPAILAELRAMRALLPGGVAAWMRHDASSPSFPLDGGRGAIERGDVGRLYGAIHGSEFIGVALGVRRPITLTARSSLTVTLFGRLGKALEERSLGRGERWTIPATLGGYLFRTRLREGGGG